jgi:hypothetical protein
MMSEAVALDLYAMVAPLWVTLRGGRVQTSKGQS